LKPIRFHPEALAEFAEAARFYERQQKGLGLRFIDAFEGALSRLKRNSNLFRTVEGDVRKCRLMRFPYGVLFRERANATEIVALMHLHREPNYWKRRI
jgi:hypothetical protein